MHSRVLKKKTESVDFGKKKSTQQPIGWAARVNDSHFTIVTSEKNDRIETRSRERDRLFQLCFLFFLPSRRRRPNALRLQPRPTQPRRAGHAASAAPARASWAPAAATPRGDTQSSRVPHANNNTRRRRHCGDLQNEQPNPALNARDRKMCYYFEPIRAAIAQPFSTRLCGHQILRRVHRSSPLDGASTAACTRHTG